jgi:hypothetical protein
MMQTLMVKKIMRLRILLKGAGTVSTVIWPPKINEFVRIF